MRENENESQNRLIKLKARASAKLRCERQPVDLRENEFRNLGRFKSSLEQVQICEKPMNKFESVRMRKIESE